MTLVKLVMEGVADGGISPANTKPFGCGFDGGQEMIIALISISLIRTGMLSSSTLPFIPLEMMEIATKHLTPYILYGDLMVGSNAGQSNQLLN